MPKFKDTDVPLQIEDVPTATNDILSWANSYLIIAATDERGKYIKTGEAKNIIKAFIEALEISPYVRHITFVAIYNYMVRKSSKEEIDNVLDVVIKKLKEINISIKDEEE